MKTAALDDLARGLGWFSIALGAGELLAGRSLAASIGMQRSAPLLRVYGAREIATGIGILTAEDPTPFLWGRVGGDALDISTLAAGLGDNRRIGGLMFALISVLGVTALDVICARGMAERKEARHRTVFDYSDRVGMRRLPDEMRGAARRTTEGAAG